MAIQHGSIPESMEQAFLIKSQLSQVGPVYILQLDQEGRLLGKDGSILGYFYNFIEEDGKDAWIQAWTNHTLPTYTDLYLRWDHQNERQWIEWIKEDKGWCGYASSAQEVLWRRRLMSRDLGLTGLRHDLNNRLFMLRALPELSQFSEPEDLLQDLMDDLPLTLTFFAERFSTEWLQSRLIHRIADDQEMVELSRLLFLVQQRGYPIQGAFGDQVIDPSSTTCEVLSPAFSGVLWSLCFLGAYLRPAQRQEWSSESTFAPQGEQISLQLIFRKSVKISKSFSCCGRAIPQIPLRTLTLMGAQIPWTIWGAECPAPCILSAQSTLDYSFGEPSFHAWKDFIIRWLETWITAANLLGGGVVLSKDLGIEQDGLSLYFP